ncbi:uncharacterized protein LOC117648293 isoform X2 [Thrips palmi]|uniref:Uncharacterized protein LOC117648293 isoform X2 n=1 Tax=Thrips palmi TaxID=161013 RepID=A0A6P8Z877_THRPL|nr:uncharacterized protein LOC117648293 isoform X2 [Thrips palmi]
MEPPAFVRVETSSCSENISSTPSERHLVPASTAVLECHGLMTTVRSSSHTSSQGNSIGFANQEVSSCSVSAPIHQRQQHLSRIIARNEHHGQSSPVPNSSQRGISDGPSNQEQPSGSRSMSARNGDGRNLSSIPQNVGRSPLLNVNQNVVRTSGVDRVPPVLSADIPERELRSSAVDILNDRPNLSEVDMRHEMAIHLVIEYPKMRKRLMKRTDMPWHHWFNADTNTGFLENANVGLQRNDKKMTGRGIRRSKQIPRQPRKLVEIPSNSVDTQEGDPDPIEFTRNVTSQELG